MPKFIYSIKEIIADAKKYYNRRDWKKNSPHLYEAARPRRRNILEQATAHMKVLPNSVIKKWTHSAILKDASKYKSKSDWQRSSNGYAAAIRQKIFKKATAHMLRPDQTQKWDKSTVIKSAKKFKVMKRWIEKFGGAYNVALQKGWLQESTKHMLIPGGTFGRKWTKDKILKEAKKYKHSVDWMRGSSGSYSAAIKMGILKNATKHMTKKKVTNAWRIGMKKPLKWTDEELNKSATKYKSLFEWRKKEPSAYGTAAKRKLLSKLTKHMVVQKKINYWTNEKILKSALRYNYKSTWHKLQPTAYSLALKRGIFKRATKHMGLLGSRFYRCIYSIEIKHKKIIYIGLTYNFKRRIRDHLNSKRFKSLSRKFGKNSLQAKKLTKYILKEKASKLESKIVQKFKKRKYDILNISKTGGLGGTTIKWTKDLIFQNAKKYKTRTEWWTRGRGAYAAAKQLKIFRQATKHMELKWEKKWNKTNIISSTKGFKKITHWKNKYPGAQLAARRLGIYKGITKKIFNN